MVWRDTELTLPSDPKPDFNLIPYQALSGENRATSLLLSLLTTSSMTKLDSEKLTLLLSHIALDASVEAIEPLQLGFSNRSFRMTIIRPGATPDSMRLGAQFTWK